MTTIRIFSAYGPWDDPGRLVPSVMASLDRGEAPRVTNGCQPRDWIHVDDVIDLFEKAARNPRAAGTILNAGSGRRQTVRDMVEMIVDVCCAGRLRPIYGELPLRADEPVEWLADVGETSDRLDWTPTLDLRAGVERTWNWFQSENKQRLQRTA